MKIIVCVKQVPDTSGKVAVNPDGTLSRLIEHRTDRTHTAVHHIGWCYHICSGFHMRKSGLCKQIQRPIIVHIVSAQHAAVSV